MIIVCYFLAMLEGISVYPFVNSSPKTKQLPLLQSLCEYMCVCAQSGWSLSSLYENSTLGLPLFLTSEQCIFACVSVSTYIYEKSCLCGDIYVYMYVKHVSWDWKKL